MAIMEAGRLLASGEPGEIGDRLRGGHDVVVRLAGGEEQRYTVTGEEAQRELLRRLVVDEGLPVVEFREEGAGLEQLFMDVTEGKVQ